MSTTSFLARLLEDDDATKNTNSLAQNMYGYVVPVFVDIIWLLAWIMIAMKSMKGSLSTGRGGGWCRMLCLILCVFQSFFGFCVVHTIVQPWSLVLMLFPAIGFIGFSSNNTVWLIAFARPLLNASACVHRSDCCIACRSSSCSPGF